MAKATGSDAHRFRGHRRRLGRLIEIKEQMLTLAEKDANPFFVPLYLGMLREGCRKIREDLEEKAREGKLGKRSRRSTA